jgi:hypothetical protein
MIQQWIFLAACVAGGRRACGGVFGLLADAAATSLLL